MGKFGFTIPVMHPKDANRTVNSVDPDRTSLIWICTFCSDMLWQYHISMVIELRFFASKTIPKPRSVYRSRLFLDRLGRVKLYYSKISKD